MKPVLFMLIVPAFCCLRVLADASIAPACTANEYRQFDFWLGDWTVTDPQGKKAGNSSITRSIDGCALHEHYRGQKGYYGESLNSYDVSQKRWHQSWVDNSGALLLLDGAFRDGKMVLAGEGRNPHGMAILHRISWQTNSDGTVRQLWESSTDGGNAWTVQFDGTYTRKKNKSGK